MFDRNSKFHFESDLDLDDPQHVLLETRVVDLSTVTISQDKAGLLVVTRNVEADDDDDDEPEVADSSKYRLVPEGNMFRVIATRAIDRYYVDAGDRGGLVWTSSALSQEGDAWVADSAVVNRGCYVSDNALVDAGSILTGGASVRGDAVVMRTALNGSVAVANNAILSDCAVDATQGHIVIAGVASFDECRIDVPANADGWAVYGGCVRNAHLRSRFELVSFYTGVRFGWLDVFRGAEGDQRFSIGCQNHGSADEIRRLGREYGISEVERGMLEGFLQLAATAKGGWLPEPTVTPFKSGDTAMAEAAPATGGPVAAVSFSQYGERIDGQF